MCVCVCVRACVRACVRLCVCVCVRLLQPAQIFNCCNLSNCQQQQQQQQQRREESLFSDKSHFSSGHGVQMWRYTACTQLSSLTCTRLSLTCTQLSSSVDTVCTQLSSLTHTACTQQSSLTQPAHNYRHWRSLHTTIVTDTACTQLS